MTLCIIWRVLGPGRMGKDQACVHGACSEKASLSRDLKEVRNSSHQIPAGRRVLRAEEQKSTAQGPWEGMCLMPPGTGRGWDWWAAGDEFRAAMGQNMRDVCCFANPTGTLREPPGGQGQCGETGQSRRPGLPARGYLGVAFLLSHNILGGLCAWCL